MSNTLFGVFNNLAHGVYWIPQKGYCSCLGILNAHAIPLVGYPINLLGSITYLLKLGRVLHSRTKT